MGISFRSTRPLRIAAIAAVLAFASVVAVPAVALAATFSSKAPVSGSSSTDTRPTVKVYVYDKYGVRGTTSYTMKLDNKSVKPSLAYKTRGNYTGMTLSYRPATGLTVGSHTALVRVKNLRGTWSQVTWKFTVKATAPPVSGPMPQTIALTACSSCHTGYPGAHPMTACESCHGAGRPVTGTAYRSATATDAGSESAHTLSCALETCHAVGVNTFPHVLSSAKYPCATCHAAGAFAGVPASHGTYSDSVHTSTSTSCVSTGCHLASLTVEHYRRSIGGVRLSCATCHASSDPAVIAALRNRSTDCTDCHNLATLAHPASKSYGHVSTIATQTLSGTLDGGKVAFTGAACSLCHQQADVAIVHGNDCAKCHPAPRSTFTAWNRTCTQGGCHSAASTAPMHGGMATGHTITPISCTTASCHFHSGDNDAAAIHATVGGCALCHGAGRTPTTDCTRCHNLDNAHTKLTSTTHTAPGTTQVDGRLCVECHPQTDVTVLHAGTVSGCAACHATGRTASLNCLNCHAANLHPTIAAKHAVSGSCITPACHRSDVRQIHASAETTIDGVAVTSCGVCHDSGDALTVDCTSSKCHGTGNPHPAGTHTSDIASETITVDGVPHACSECHTSAELPTIHGGAGSCSTCHSVPVATTLGGAWNKTCIQGGCHTPTSTKPMHGSITAAHARLSANASCSGGVCHNGTDLATIHKSAETTIDGKAVTSCGVCHAAGDPASANCTTCHGDKVSGGTVVPHYNVGLHTARVTTGTVNVSGVAYAVNCGDCHGTGLDLSVVHGNKCSTCHPSPRNSFEKWSGSCIQGGCHTPNSTAPAHATLDASHAILPANAGCNAMTWCHNGARNLAAIHVGAQTTIDGKTVTSCGVCHSGGRLPASGNCASCHDISKVHMDPAKWDSAHTAPASTCVQVGCHAATLDIVHKSVCADCHAAGRTPSVVCANCHGDDLSPRHAFADSLHTSTASCVAPGCHNANLAKLHSAAGGPGCTACHGAGQTTTLDCSTVGCHEGGVTEAHTSHPATVESGEIVINDVSYGDHACADCHASTDLQVVHGGTTSCSKCHPQPANSAKPWNGGCAQGNCHAGTSTIPMHGKIDASHTLAEAPSCIRTDCHVGGTDVAAIHGVKGGPGCAACHGDGKTPTLDCSSEGCHSDTDTHPASDPHPAMDPGHTVGLTSTCVKAGCHPADLPGIHQNKFACATCHRNGKQPTQDCATVGCHPTYTGSSSHPLYVQKHTLESTPTCIGSDCHSATNALDVRKIHVTLHCSACHAADKPELTLQCSTCHATLDHIGKHDVTRTDDCVTCHAGTNLTAIKLSTGADSKHATCATCHKSTDAAVIAAIAGSDKSCAACHATLDHIGKHDVTRTDDCVTCHAGTNLTAILKSTGADSKHATCATCHKSTDDAVIAAIAGSDKSCAACHATLDHVGKHDVVRTDACVDCHAGTNLTAILKSTGADSKHATCATCHKSTDDAVIAAIAGSDKSCSACHATLDHTTKHNLPTTRIDGCTGAACHDGTNLTAIQFSGSVSTKHSACATCHKSTKPEVVSAIANNDLRCSACHTNPHAADHAWCNTCHDDLNSYSNGGHDSTSIPTDRSCATCHGTTFVALDGLSWYQAPGPYHNTGSDACYGGCHNGGSVPAGEPAVHAVVPDVRCVGCHAGTVLTSITLSTGAISPVHATCATCHGATTRSDVKAVVAAGGPASCADCHAGHDIPTIHTVTRTDACVSCHAGTQLASITLSSGAVSTVHETCSTCHSASARSQVKNAISSGHAVCSDCHGTGMPASHAAHVSTQTVGTIRILGVDYTNQTCSTCHTSTDLQNVPGHGACTTCHANPANSVPVGSFSCAQGNCHAGTSAIKMHSTLDASHTTPASAQTNCSGATCHGTVSGNVAEIHKNYGGCADCHNNPQGHPASLVCSTCHAAHGDLTTIHTATMTSASFTIAGAGVGTVACVTCHPSADLRTVHTAAGACTACHPGIKTALGGTTTWTGSCTQGTCHGAGSLHPYHATQNNHVSSNPSCISADCHANGNVAVIHNATASKCAACHATGKPPLTLVCGTSGCHPAITNAASHPKYSNHTVAATGCSAGGSCHQTSMITIHGRTGCAACHSAGKPSLVGATCATCHGGSGVGTTVTGVAGHVAIHGYCNDCHAYPGQTDGHSAPGPITAASSCIDCHTAPIGSPSSAQSGMPHGDYDSCAWSCH